MRVDADASLCRCHASGIKLISTLFTSHAIGFCHFHWISCSFFSPPPPISNSLYAIGCHDTGIHSADGSNWPTYITSLWIRRNVYIFHFHYDFVFDKGKFWFSILFSLLVVAGRWHRQAQRTVYVARISMVKYGRLWICLRANNGALGVKQ